MVMRKGENLTYNQLKKELRTIFGDNIKVVGRKPTNTGAFLIRFLDDTQSKCEIFGIGPNGNELGWSNFVLLKKVKSGIQIDNGFNIVPQRWQTIKTKKLTDIHNTIRSCVEDGLEILDDDLDVESDYLFGISEILGKWANILVKK